MTFANVDDRLTLVVDGLLPFGDGRVCEPDGSWTRSVPATADLEPARIAAQGTSLEVTQLVLKRDIYYTLQPGESDQISPDDLPHEDPRGFFDLLADPARYASLGPPPRAIIRWGPGATSCWETIARGAGMAEPGEERTRSIRLTPAAAGMNPGARAGRCPSR